MNREKIVKVTIAWLADDLVSKQRLLASTDSVEMAINRALDLAEQERGKVELSEEERAAIKVQAQEIVYVGTHKGARFKADRLIDATLAAVNKQIAGSKP